MSDPHAHPFPGEIPDPNQPSGYGYAQQPEGFAPYEYGEAYPYPEQASENPDVESYDPYQQMYGDESHGYSAYQQDYSTYPQMYGEYQQEEYLPEYGVEAPQKKPRVKAFALWGGVFLTLALFYLGVAAGWIVNDRLQESTASTTPEVVEIAGAEEGSDIATVPDVRGLTATAAKQALADSGFDAAKISTEDQEWAGTAGVVVAQDPVVGEPVDGGITLTVSVEAKVPDLAGMSEADAIDTLRLLGAEVLTTDEFQAAQPTGTVLAQEPAAGETLPAIVHLTVAEAGSSMFLSMLDYADDSSSCSTDDVVMNGQKFSDALNCRAGGDDGYTYAWALSKNVSLFEATIGVSDGAATDASARISIFGDNTLLYSGTVAHGVPQNVSVDTTGVLRLEIIIASDEYTSVYLGDATLIGPSDGIDALATTP